MNPIDGLVPDWRALPGAPAPGTELCQLADVPADNGLERRFGPAGSGFSVVLFRAGESVCAFVNRCPHAGIALNFGDDVFCLFDSDGQRDVICPHHSALFRLPEGVCHEGPCRDDRLTPVPLAVEAGVVRIAPAR